MVRGAEKVTEPSKEEASKSREAVALRLKAIPPRPDPEEPGDGEDESPPPPPATGGTTTLEVRGLPVDRKIELTTKTLMMIDWFIAKFKYPGDTAPPECQSLNNIAR